MKSDSPLQSQRLLGEATAATQLEDFGPADFRQGLELYCDSARTEARLTPFGELALSSMVRDHLVRRLRVIDWVKRHPDVLEEQITRPTFVVGLFRAGTTLLSYLLDQDPANRSLLGWEAADPVPPPVPGSHRSGPRVQEALARQGLSAGLTPALNAMHHEEADGPTECVSVMAQDFKSLLWETVANVPAYGAWLSEVDHRSAYAYHRTVLQTLQSAGVRGKWVLKSPHHALALEAIRAIYPDATFVVLHRDPVVVVASACSLVRSLSGTFSDTDHTDYLATRWTGVLADSITRMEAFRAQHPDQLFIDLHYDQLVRDSVGTVEDLYSRLGRPLDEVTRAAMTHYVAEHPKGQFGPHRYELAEVGLDASVLRDRFGGYTARYAVTPED